MASESAKEIKTLVGVAELTKALTKVNDLKDKAVDCFSRHTYTTNLQKWTFDNVNNKWVSSRFIFFVFLQFPFSYTILLEFHSLGHPVQEKPK